MRGGMEHDHPHVVWAQDAHLCEGGSSSSGSRLRWRAPPYLYLNVDRILRRLAPRSVCRGPQARSSLQECPFPVPSMKTLESCELLGNLWALRQQPPHLRHKGRKSSDRVQAEMRQEGSTRMMAQIKAHPTREKRGTEQQTNSIAVIV